VTEISSRLDIQRFERLGMIEAVWGEHKSTKQIAEILNKFKKKGQIALVTRVNQEKAMELISLIENIEFHTDAECLTLGKPFKEDISLGKVIILSGGTSDFKVASEANLALKLHGIQTEMLIDIGVAGLHRLLNKLEKIRSAKVLIACAGMEGALPTVLAGLVPQPIIGIPVSIGYGVSAKGKSALEGMLSSCAPGLMVVNIDNGYGAAMAALRILNS
tara:strand:- start:749 stop:1402 length:654 start_codon:yes stop_codon:yes gene_type:complete